jgi:hypothetical protein
MQCCRFLQSRCYFLDTSALSPSNYALRRRTGRSFSDSTTSHFFKLGLLLGLGDFSSGMAFMWMFRTVGSVAPWVKGIVWDVVRYFGRCLAASIVSK